ncbi:hypothetical protein DVJ83_17855 (plasmid) [Deinococcus wulumuqiensis]|uniref:Uncharacterized protein n=1 Tax=Deinococcus wulumuqiensis TaxID=980427 RepID=A0A345IMP1_9DEIO|nr:hypothetical protein DVJ83_17855 [Deinococcus wulumuqiensis]
MPPTAAQRILAEYHQDPQAWQNVLAHQDVFGHFLEHFLLFAERHPFLQLDVERYRPGASRPLHAKARTRQRIGWQLDSVILLYTDACEGLLRTLLGQVHVEYEYVPGSSKPHHYRAEGAEGVSVWSPLALLRLCEQLAACKLLRPPQEEGVLTRAQSPLLSEFQGQDLPPFLEWTGDHLHLNEHFARTHLLSHAVAAFRTRFDAGVLSPVVLELAARARLIQGGYGLLNRSVFWDRSEENQPSEWLRELLASTPERSWHTCSDQDEPEVAWLSLEAQAREQGGNVAPPSLPHTSDRSEQLLLALRRTRRVWTAADASGLLHARLEDAQARLDELEAQGLVLKQGDGYRACDPHEAIAVLLSADPDRTWTAPEIARQFPKLDLNPAQVRAYLFALAADGMEMEMQFKAGRHA